MAGARKAAVPAKAGTHCSEQPAAERCVPAPTGTADLRGFPGSASVGSLLNATAAELAAAGFDEPQRLARRLLAAALDLSAAEVFAYPERRIAAAEAARLADTLRRTLTREPLSRIQGKREFWGLEFTLSPDTLDPRPETETAVEAVLARLPDRGRPYRFLDLGTGSGCLLLSLLAEYRRALGIGVDIAAAAVQTARTNATALGLADRAHFVVGNWAAALAGGFDVVVANPPYIESAAIAGLPPEVREHDPHRALDGGPDGLAAYRAIAADLPRLLSPGALFAAEIGAGQADAVSAILRGHGVDIDAVLPDLAGIARCVVARRPLS